MATFEKIVQGPRARCPSFLPLSGARFNVEKNTWEGPGAHLDVIALSEEEYGAVLKAAREYAIKYGVADPKPDDELYERGVMLNTVVRACVDQDVRDEEQPFFPGGVEQILGSKILLPEAIAYLYEVQRHHQDEVNPLVKDLSPAEYTAALITTAGGDKAFFVSSRHGLQWSFTRTLASRQLVSMSRESPSGGPTDAAPSTTGE